jgi:DNA-binding protein H-NS
MEVENLSKDQLEDLIKKAQNQIVVVENKKLDDGYLKMFEIAKELGLTALLHKDLKCKSAPN